MVNIRQHHAYQSAAMGRIAKARELLAEAAGLLRACDRQVPKDDFFAEGLLRPGETAREIEEAESQLSLITNLINKAPAGDTICL